MAIYLNEIVSKNSSVSNNIIVVSNQADATKIRDSLDSQGSSFIATGRLGEKPKVKNFEGLTPINASMVNFDQMEEPKNNLTTKNSTFGII